MGKHTMLGASNLPKTLVRIVGRARLVESLAVPKSKAITRDGIYRGPNRGR